MSTMQQTEESIRAPRISPRVAWGLLGGGVFFETIGRVVGLTYAHGDSGQLYLHFGLPF